MEICSFHLDDNGKNKFKHSLDQVVSTLTLIFVFTITLSKNNINLTGTNLSTRASILLRHLKVAKLLTLLTQSPFMSIVSAQLSVDSHFTLKRGSVGE